MKYIVLSLLLAALLLLAACESGGKFRVVNQTSFPLYVTLGDGPETVIPGAAEHTFSVDTPSQHIFKPGVEQEVPVRILGETYHMYDDYEEIYTDSTSVTIKVGETLNAFITPNRASFKAVNASSQVATRISLYKHNFVAPQLVAEMLDLAPGEMRFLRVDYATANNNFYYYVVVKLQDETELTFGGPTTVLDKDQQLLVTLTDPE